MKTFASLGVLAVVVLASSSANAAALVFAGDFDPALEVTPPDVGDHNPNGGVVFNYDDATMTLCGRIEYDDLTGPATGIHVHQAPKGMPNADGAATDKVIIPVAASGLTFKVILNPSWATSLVTGEIYTNIHTTINPNGEMRARMDPYTDGDLDPVDCATATLVQLPGAATPDAGATDGGGSTSSSSSSSTSSSSGSSGTSSSSSSGNGDNPSTTSSSSGAAKAPIAPADDTPAPAKSGCSSTASTPANVISMGVLGAFALIGLRARRRNKKR